MSYLPEAAAAIERFTCQVGALYEDKPFSFRVKTFVLLSNLKNTAPGVSFLIPHSKLNFEAKSLVALFAHIVRTKWADSAKSFCIRLTPAADKYFVEFTETRSHATWRFSLGRHFDLSPSAPLWWKLTYFGPIPQETETKHECPVCLKRDAETMILPECKHRFHAKCLNKIKDIDACPTCNCSFAAKEEHDICPICLDSDDSLMILPMCGHRFHRDCMSKWVLTGNFSCPTCSCSVLPQ